MARQTNVQETSTIRFGSGRFDVYDTVAPGWVNLGAMRDIQFEETWDKVRVMSDNAGPVVIGIRNHHAALQGNLMEINLDNLALLRGGLDVVTPVAGVAVPGDTHILLEGSWEFEKFYPLPGQQHDGSIPTAISADAGTDGALVQAPAPADNADFAIVKDGGVWGIVLFAAGDKISTTGLAQNVTVTYTYTPAAHRTFETGAVRTIEPVAVRVVNIDEEGKEFIIEVFKATVENGIVIELPSDEEEDPAMTEIRLQGDVDTAPATNRLFKITDYQHV